MVRIKQTVKRTLPKSAQEWIEVAKKKLGTEKNGDIARAMGSSKQAISNYVQGRNAIGAKEAIKLGWLINEDPIRIIIESTLVASGWNNEWLSLLDEYSKRKHQDEIEPKKG